MRRKTNHIQNLKKKPTITRQLDHIHYNLSHIFCQLPMAFIPLKYLFSRFIGILIACSVTFVHHGPGLKANLPYWTGSLSLADCQNSCKEDISCGGIAYNPSSSGCTKTGRSQSRLNPQCPTCTFYHKQCGTGILYCIQNNIRPCFIFVPFRPRCQ